MKTLKYRKAKKTINLSPGEILKIEAHKHVELTIIEKQIKTIKK